MVNTPVSVEEVWSWLAEVEDPEIPVISIVDLGIVREVRWQGVGETAECVVTLTPTYSGCPATHVIAQDVTEALRLRGIPRVRLENRVAPAWTTDWMTESGKQKLQAWGIAPPGGRASEQVIRIEDIGGRMTRPEHGTSCPRCGSTRVELASQFGSTPCKALYRCRSCLEPFDLFKCH